MTVMKDSSLLTFNNKPKDLSVFGECWISESIAEREEKILAEIRAWHIREHHLDTEEAVRRLEEHMPYALLPSKNIRLIREVSFPIGDAVTIDELKEIIPKLREKFVIDCFQAAIDRRHHVARMVFDWYDRSCGSCVYLYPNKRIRLSVFLVRELDLSRLKGLGKTVYVLGSVFDELKPELMYLTFDGFFTLYEPLFNVLDDDDE